MSTSITRSLAGLIVVLFTLVLSPAPLQADTDYELPTQAESARVNDNAVGVLFTHEELFHQLVHDMEHALEHSSGIRIVPVMGKNHLQSIYDLLYLKGIDLAMVRADAIEYVKRKGGMANIDSLVNSVVKLSDERLVLIARSGFDSVASLDGQAVGFGSPGTPEHVTGTIAFESMGIAPKAREVTSLTGIKQLRAGELAAMLYLLRADDAIQTGADLQTADAIQRLSREEDLHVLPLEQSDAMSAIYTPATLTHDDLPGLIAQQDTVATYSVDAILAGYRWPTDSPRYPKVERFVEALFDELDELQTDAYQPAWKRVDMRVDTPNVPRLAIVTDTLQSREASTARLAEAERLAEERRTAEARAQRMETLMSRRNEITARLERDLSDADITRLERMLSRLDEFLASTSTDAGEATGAAEDEQTPAAE